MTHEHTTVRWEYDPNLKRFTIRCPRCGHILSEITLEEALESPTVPEAIKKFLKTTNTEVKT